jgi:diketogulonate reductase-like aldo/keto reductase
VAAVTVQEPVGRHVHLNNGVPMPVLGLGVWSMSEGKETENAVRWALETGYRLIDTAKLYGNEVSVGKAVRASGIPRGEVFVTTKLWPTDFWRVERAFERSLQKLDIGYIDLYLIHFPAEFIPGFGAIRRRVWNTLEKLYARKLACAIGVSNYSARTIDETIAAGTIPPAVNQIKMNPFSYDSALVAFCKSRNVAVEAYSPLTRARRLNHPVIRKIAAVHSRSPAQVLIRWALQHGTIVIPKSSRRDRIIENAGVFDFELTAGEIQSLDALGTQ